MSLGAQAFSLPLLALIQSAATLPKPAITRDTAPARRTHEMEIPLKFNEAELKAIQRPRSAHYELSSTFSASLTMENDGRICAAIDAKRRIDGTVTAADVKAIFNEMDVQVDEWAHGPLDFETLAANFNEDREPVPIPDVVRESLVSLKFDVDSAALVQQLDRNDYNRVNKILEALGGKWNKKAVITSFPAATLKRQSQTIWRPASSISRRSLASSRRRRCWPANSFDCPAYDLATLSSNQRRV